MNDLMLEEMLEQAGPLEKKFASDWNLEPIENESPLLTT